MDQTRHILNDFRLADFRRNLLVDVLLIVLTFGWWQLVLQSHQIKTLNLLLKEERYSLLKLIFLSILTFTLYYIYHQYKKAQDFEKILNPDQPASDQGEAILAAILSFISLSWVYDCILQSRLNDLSEKAS